METFFWQVAPSMSEKAEPKIKTIKFGDGYEQRIKDGINNDLRSYSVTLKVAREDAQHINDFLTRHGGLHAFKWIEPNTHRLITVKCTSWTSNVMNTVTTITATFEEVIA
ncbi:phage tail protein [Candidatus Schmidhempelia bombi]|jgi:phage-related protein|uniref:Phage tail protein n=1 Tax=Candidatus Schmidhempelia bombi str. Bimp TaxID=1387197 RepID=A0AB94IA33_9GAMM|nr:phage tail protein [Candidatus Schmidhempelia bombi]TEA26239.1 phage tail protein [Candidatus Schmidhempelia bombi str. Bimp]